MIDSYYLIYSTPSGSLWTSKHKTLGEIYNIIVELKLQMGYYSIIKNGEKIV